MGLSNIFRKAPARGALTSAAFISYKGEIIRLLELGADINEKDAYGQTALMIAISMWGVAYFKENEEIALLLIDKGANVNEKDDLGDTALILAVSKGLTDVVKVLIDKGADFDIRNSNGHTAETLVARVARPEIIQLLKEARENRQRQVEEKAERRKKALLGAVVLPHDSRRPRLKFRLPKRGK